MEYLSPATKLRQGNVFTPVCDSFHRGGLCPVGSLSKGVLCPGGSLSREVCVQVGLCPRGLCPGGLCPGSLRQRGSLSRGSLLRGSLSRGVSVQGTSSVRETPTYGNMWTISILLECIFVLSIICKEQYTRHWRTWTVLVAVSI